MGKRSTAPRPAVDPIVTRLERRAAEIGMTLEEVGRRMHYRRGAARQAVYAFFRTPDPRLSTVRRACAALGLKLEDVLK